MSRESEWALRALGFDECAEAMARYLKKYMEFERERLNHKVQNEVDGNEKKQNLEHQIKNVSKWGSRLKLILGHYCSKLLIKMVIALLHSHLEQYLFSCIMLITDDDDQDEHDDEIKFDQSLRCLYIWRCTWSLKILIFGFSKKEFRNTYNSIITPTLTLTLQQKSPLWEGGRKGSMGLIHQNYSN